MCHVTHVSCIVTWIGIVPWIGYELDWPIRLVQWGLGLVALGLDWFTLAHWWIGTLMQIGIGNATLHWHIEPCTMIH